MTKKAEKTEDVKLTYEESLIKQKEHLEGEIKKAEANYHQMTGALSMVSMNLEEFLKSK